MAEMTGFEKFFANSNIFNAFFHRWFGMNRLLRWAQVKPCKNILELGCGVGMTTCMISEKFADARIVALDYDKDQIAKAKKQKCQGRIQYMTGDASYMKFQDSTFDLAIQSLAFHHIPYYKQAIDETRRVLKKGGRFLIMDFSTKGLLPFGLQIHASPFSREEFISELEGAGFTVKNKKGRMLFFIEAIRR